MLLFCIASFNLLKLPLFIEAKSAGDFANVNKRRKEEAVKMIADTDKRRMTNYNFYTEQKWGNACNYTLCLNSSQLGYENCEKIIMECVK